MNLSQFLPHPRSGYLPAKHYEPAEGNSGWTLRQCASTTPIPRQLYFVPDPLLGWVPNKVGSYGHTMPSDLHPASGSCHVWGRMSLVAGQAPAAPNEAVVPWAASAALPPRSAKAISQIDPSRHPTTFNLHQNSTYLLSWLMCDHGFKHPWGLPTTAWGSLGKQRGLLSQPDLYRTIDIMNCQVGRTQSPEPGHEISGLSHEPENGHHLGGWRFHLFTYVMLVLNQRRLHDHQLLADHHQLRW